MPVISGTGAGTYSYGPSGGYEADAIAKKSTGSASVQCTIYWSLLAANIVDSRKPMGATGYARVEMYYDSTCTTNCAPLNETATASSDTPWTSASCSGYAGEDDDNDGPYLSVLGSSLQYTMNLDGTWDGAYNFASDSLSASVNVTASMPNVACHAEGSAFSNFEEIYSNTIVITL